MEVSICIITYNQENFIERAIDSALAQSCNFSCEIIISDDCSTDNSQAIIKRYAALHPNKIKPFYAIENTGMLRNWEKALTACSGKYIALLEGDDFWTDIFKLQKQFDLLETHPECSMSFTNAKIDYNSGQKGYEIYVDKTDEFYSTKDLVLKNFIPTCSVVMRNNITSSFFPKTYFASPFADWIIHILTSRFGKIHFLNEFTCTYQIHNMGVWGGAKKEKQLTNKLKALDCIYQILPEPELREVILANKKTLLQEICFHFKNSKMFLQYLNYRVKLIMI